MQQSGGMDELDTGGELNLPLPLIAAELGGGQSKQRAHALAPRRDDMRGKLGNEHNGAVHPGDDGFVGSLQLRLEQPGQAAQGIGRQWRRTVQIQRPNLSKQIALAPYRAGFQKGQAGDR